MRNQVENKILSIEGDFTIIDIVQILSSDELRIAFDILDFLIQKERIGIRIDNNRMVYFVVQ